MHLGEAGTAVLYSRVKADFLIIDELPARSAVLKFDVPRNTIVGTLGILFMLQEHGQMTGRPISPLKMERWLSKMKQKGYAIAPKLYEWAVGEFKRRRK